MTLHALYPLKLSPSFRPKIWGRRELSPLFDQQTEPIGEAWFSFEENVIANGPFQDSTLGEIMRRFGSKLMGDSYRPWRLERRSAGQSGAGTSPKGPYFPILCKFLFTSDNLSVQVHPDDVYALRHEGGPGKTEMWYVVDAAPGAAVALGLTKRLTAGELRSAAQSGEIAGYLNWVEVRPGQAYFVPPGTLHSIGANLVLCEIQQNSDLTYRFFDFGRLDDDGKPRALHIDEAVAVVRQTPHPGPAQLFRFRDHFWKRELLAACRHFAVEHFEWNVELDYQPDPARAHLMVVLKGRGRLGSEPYRPGDVYLIPAEAPAFAIRPESTTEAIRSYVPDLAALREELRHSGVAEQRIQQLIYR